MDERPEQADMWSRPHEPERIKRIKEECQKSGRELLTPLAVVSLFGISAAAVRLARMHKVVAAYVRLAVTGKPVELILLDTALQYWRRSPEELEHKLAGYRENGTILAVDSEFYSVLHPSRIARRL